MDWKRALLVTGGAAGAGALIYYLLREEAQAAALPAEDKKLKEDTRIDRAETLTKEEVLRLLADWRASVEEMKVHMKTIGDELRQKDFTFDQTYLRIKEVEPTDALQKHDVSEMEFDQVIRRFQDDLEIKEAISQIVTLGSSSSKDATNKESSITVKKVIDVHAYMLEELDRSISTFDSLKEQTPKDHYDLKTVSLALQAIIGAKVQEKFSVSPEDIERAVICHHAALVNNQEFTTISKKMQTCMAQVTKP